MKLTQLVANRISGLDFHYLLADVKRQGVTREFDELKENHRQ